MDKYYVVRELIDGVVEELDTLKIQALEEKDQDEVDRIDAAMAWLDSVIRELGWGHNEL